MNRFKSADLNKVKMVTLAKRANKSETAFMGHVIGTKGAKDFFEALPKQLKAADLNDFIDLTIGARKKELPFHMLMGAHVIKVGLSKIIIDLMKRKIVTGISLNSAGLIHDLELAFIGQTSEDVQSGLDDGSFGMAQETGNMFDEVVALAEKKSIGLGEAAGIYINKENARFKEFSLLAAADKHNLPSTVHLVIGTDIVQQQPTFRAGPAAEASYLDFKILAEILTRLNRGGSIANIGSAVVLPEVFLKALTVARNLTKGKSKIITANFDMINHYRPFMNVVKRPTCGGGRGFNFTGHHEIMIPLLAWGLKSKYK